MKLEIITTEIVTKRIFIETEDFDVDTTNKDKEVFQTASLINDIKQDPKDFMNQFKEEELEIENTFKNVSVTLNN